MSTFAGQRVVDPILTRIVAEGMDQPYLVDQGVYSLVKVDQMTGTFLSDDPRAYNSFTGDIVRARGAPRSTGFAKNPISGIFTAEEFAHEIAIDLNQDRKIDQILDLEQRRAAQAARVVKLKAELRLRDSVFDSGFWPGSTTGALPGGSTQTWDNPSGTPFADMNVIFNNIFHLQAFGERVNTIVMGQNVATALNASPEVRGYLPGLGTTSGVGSRILSANDEFGELRLLIGQHLGIDPNRVFIGGYVQDTANPGQATAVKGLVWDGSTIAGGISDGGVWFGRVDPKQYSASAGTVPYLAPTAAADFSPMPFEVGAYQTDDKLFHVPFAQQQNAYTQVNSDLGFLLRDVLA
ncbi:MAG: hypothetical protein COA38_20570 [Fluviicola sp.]|nr:MAG: hypothetical protein COA38_20570 [Fluviicola sp.]